MYFFLVIRKEVCFVSAASIWVGSLYVSKRRYVSCLWPFVSFFFVGCKGGLSSLAGRSVAEIYPPTQLLSRSVYRSLGTCICKALPRTQSQICVCTTQFRACNISLEVVHHCECTPVPSFELTPRCFFCFLPCLFICQEEPVGPRWRANRICPTRGAI